MTRYIKALGLTVVAAFAMSALAASGAQASEFTGCETVGGVCNHVHTLIHVTSEEPTAENPETGLQTFTTAVALKCWHLEGEATSLTGTDTSLTGENIKYFGKKNETTNPHCEALGLTTAVNMEGCHYRFHAGNEIAANEYTGTVDVVCPEGKEIDIRVTKEGQETGGTVKCTVQVPGEGTAKGGTQNTGLKHVIYRNKTVGEHTVVTIEAAVEGIEYTTSVGGLLGCGQANGVHQGATYKGNATATGKNTLGEPIDVSVAGK